LQLQALRAQEGPLVPVEQEQPFYSASPFRKEVRLMVLG
jgi:hypothetical protein